MTIKNTSEYKEFSFNETIKLLQSSIDGLTNAEAKRRLLKFGFNEVSEKKRSPFLTFLKRYWGPMPWLLEVAIILSVVLKHYLEAGITFALRAVKRLLIKPLKNILQIPSRKE